MIKKNYQLIIYNCKITTIEKFLLMQGYSSVPNTRPLPAWFFSEKLPTASLLLGIPPLNYFSLFLRKTWKRIALLRSQNFDCNLWTSSVNVNVRILFSKNNHCEWERCEKVHHNLKIQWILVFTNSEGTKKFCSI